MSQCKSRRTDNSPIAPKNHQKRDQRITIDLSQKNLQALQCFMPKKSAGKDGKKVTRARIMSNVVMFREPMVKHTTVQGKPQEQPPLEKQPDREEHRQQKKSVEPRKKDVSNSPDISKVLMNQVIEAIEKEGVTRRWNQDQPQNNGRRPEEHANSLSRKDAPEEVKQIWQKHNRSHLSTDYSFYSTAYLMPVQHHMSYSSLSSFNNSFTYSSNDQQFSGCYEGDSKLEINNKRIFEINYPAIERDGRTTVMIKNIPNKYSLKLLADEIDQDHSETYDFLYLPFDYNNNCNVGYAFINFINPSFIKGFYERFNQKKWSKFKSLKICMLTYARLQGRQSLIEHFYNSKVLNQKEKRYRPIIKDFTQLTSLLERQRQSQQQ